MFTKNIAVLAVAFAAELCAAGGPNFLTLCIHEDGSVRYEPTMALCCKPIEQGKGECCAHEESRSEDRHGMESDENCQDFGVTFSQVFVPRQSIRQLLLDAPALYEVLPIVAVLPVSPFSRESAAVDCCGPPRDRILHDLSTIVLRL